MKVTLGAIVGVFDGIVDGMPEEGIAVGSAERVKEGVAEGT